MSKLPQDVEEFIAGNSQTDHIRDEYGDTHYKIDVVDVDDLRAWMSGHVRVPVEPTMDMLCVALEVYGSEDCAATDVLGIYKAMLDASKEEGK